MFVYETIFPIEFYVIFVYCLWVCCALTSLRLNSEVVELEQRGGKVPVQKIHEQKRLDRRG